MQMTQNLHKSQQLLLLSIWLERSTPRMCFLNALRLDKFLCSPLTFHQERSTLFLNAYPFLKNIQKASRLKLLKVKLIQRQIFKFQFDQGWTLWTCYHSTLSTCCQIGSEIDHPKFFGSFFKKELKTHLFKIAF